MERLAHGAKRCIQPARCGTCNTQRVGDLRAIQSQQHRCRGRRRVAAKDRTRVKALVLQLASETPCPQPRGNFKAGNEGSQGFVLGLAARLGQCQCNRPSRSADMARAIEMGIVVIHAVRHGAVGQGCCGWRHSRAEQYVRLALRVVSAPALRNTAYRDGSGLIDRAQRHTEPIHQAHFGRVQHLGRVTASRCGCDEVDGCIADGGGLLHCILRECGLV